MSAELTRRYPGIRNVVFPAACGACPETASVRSTRPLSDESRDWLGVAGIGFALARDVAWPEANKFRCVPAGRLDTDLHPFGRPRAFAAWRRDPPPSVGEAGSCPRESGVRLSRGRENLFGPIRHRLLPAPGQPVFPQVDHCQPTALAAAQSARPVVGRVCRHRCEPASRLLEGPTHHQFEVLAGILIFGRSRIASRNQSAAIRKCRRACWGSEAKVRSARSISTQPRL